MRPPSCAALAALDARVLGHDGGGTADDVEHALGARINADTATGTLVSINLWSCHSLRFLPVSRALPYARLIAGLKITVTPCLRNRYFAGSILRHCCGVVLGSVLHGCGSAAGSLGTGSVLDGPDSCSSLLSEPRRTDPAAATALIADGLCYQGHGEPTPQQ